MEACGLRITCIVKVVWDVICPLRRIRSGSYLESGGYGGCQVKVLSVNDTEAEP